MSRRYQWWAILAGVLVLMGPTLVERAVYGAHVAWESLSGSQVDHDAAQRDRIATALQTRNQRLDLATSTRIADAVMRCGRDHDLAPQLVLAVLLVESSAHPEARSPKCAIGLMQVMPYMFQALEIPGNAAHIEANIQAGCLVLVDNIRRLGEEDGISAYFWGTWIRDENYLQRVRAMQADLLFELGAEVPRGRG